MLNKLRAWWQILKIVKSLITMKESKDFYKGNIVRVLEKEGWFNYLIVPRSMKELMENYQYTELELVRSTLEILTKEKILKKTSDLKYYRNREDLGTYPTTTRLQPESLMNIMVNYAGFYPNRLRGKFLDFTGGINLFNWDDALTDTLYEQMRQSCFIYSGILKYEGSFLEIGCGAGYSTAAVFNYFLKKKKFYPGTKLKISAIEPDVTLLEIAKAEFPRFLAKKSGKDKDEINSLMEYFPTFKEASILDLPFEDNTFDFVYCSQILHWTNAKKGITEMLRVTKPGGFVFGNQSVSPRVPIYAHAHVIAVKGAQGFFTKDDLIKWAKGAGAKKVKTAYPLMTVCFKFIK